MCVPRSSGITIEGTNDMRQQALKAVKVEQECVALLGIPGPQLARRIALEIERGSNERSVRIATTLTELLERFTESATSVIFIDDHLVEGVRLAEFLNQLTGSTPVVILADVERQCELARFVADGKVDFVARLGDFAPIAVSLIERRLRMASSGSLGAGRGRWNETDDLASIFRHEINNPLTGILGNAELVLAHGGNLHPSDVQRVQTVVDLAVRLRETIRKLSDAIESNSPVVR
jgi:signal transduction histidine kinase